MKKKLLIIFAIIFLSISLFANGEKDSITGTLMNKDINNKFIPIEKGTYENKDFWIKIISLCSEGEIACENIIYIGVNKNNGSYIVLKGKVFLSKNGNFAGYIFQNGKYKYVITKDNYFYIFENDKTIKESKLEIIE